MQMPAGQLYKDYFEEWFSFKLNFLEPVLDVTLKFYSNVKKFWGLILTFGEVTGQKLETINNR